VAAPTKVDANLTEKDWQAILGHKWHPKYRLALEAIKNNGNRPTAMEEILKASPGFHYGDRENANATMRKSGIPFFIQNIGHGPRDAHFQVVRR